MHRIAMCLSLGLAAAPFARGIGAGCGGLEPIAPHQR